MIENQQPGNKKPRTNAAVAPEIAGAEQRGRDKRSEEKPPEITQSPPARIPKQRQRISAPPVCKLIFVVRPELWKIESGDNYGWLPPVRLGRSVLFPIQLVGRFQSVTRHACVIERKAPRAPGEHEDERGQGRSQSFRAADCEPDCPDGPENAFER